MTDDEPETSLALMTLALAGVGIAIMALIFAAQPADGGTVCLSKREARHLWPRSHLYWYSKDHCWSNRRGPPRNLHIDPVFPKNAMAQTKEVMRNEPDVGQSTGPDNKKGPRLGGAVIKTMRQDEYNELDAQADKDVFFDATPFPFWDHHMAYDLALFETWYRRADYWK